MVMPTLGEVSQIFATLIAAIALFYAALQLRINARIAQGQFLMALDQFLDRFDSVYYPLRELHESDSASQQTFSSQEMLKIKEYMGFLEFAEILLREKSITESAFLDMFGHRVRALASVPQVMRATIYKEPTRWRCFLSLLSRFAIDPVPPESST